MTPQEIDELSVRIAKKMTLVVVDHQATITSGFNLEVLRLTARDVELLRACGIKVE